jgi:hypothetical protein
LLPNGQHGKERAVANNFAVFANTQAAPTENRFVFADFEQGDEGSFNADLSFSGSNRGFNTALSNAEAVSGTAVDGQWSQRITIIDDPNTDGGTQNPGGAWFARHVSGVGNPANNASRPAIGSVGLWAKTSDASLRISLVVDDVSGLTGERGIAQDMIADGQWHPYFWEVDDVNQWEGWVNGDGSVDDSFTLDSIQIFGPPNTGSNLDAVIYLDAITHITPGPLPGDYNNDGTVDTADFVVWRKNEGTANTLPNDPLGGTIGQAQYDQWQSHFGQIAGSGAAGSLPPQSAAPEPDALSVILAALAICSLSRRGR